MKVLYSWVGRADLDGFSSGAAEASRCGPLAAILRRERPQKAHILWGHSPVTPLGADDHQRADKWRDFCRWLLGFSPKTEYMLHTIPDSEGKAMDLVWVWEQVSRVLPATVQSDNAKLVINASSGTPVMFAVWILRTTQLGMDAVLLVSSPQTGVNTLALPPMSLSVRELIQSPPIRLVDDLVKETIAISSAFDALAPKSPAYQEAIVRAQLVARYPIPVLLVGETGVGKTTIAKAIHQASGRRAEAFHVVNCGGLPPQLVYSILFGHVKGAFTGADKKAVGYFEAAAEGTLFLDEVTELAADSQAMLLRALQDRKIVPLGSTTDIPVDVRIIAATNADLVDVIRAGRFRRDLYYRLAGAVIDVPPLRERREEIMDIASRYLQLINERFATYFQERLRDADTYRSKLFGPGVAQHFESYSWPGNIRELQNVIQELVCWGPAEEAVIPESRARAALQRSTLASGGQAHVLNRPLGWGFSLTAVIDEVERHYVERAWEQSGNSKVKATQLVGYPNRQMLDRRLRKYGLA